MVNQTKLENAELQQKLEAIMKTNEVIKMMHAVDARKSSFGLSGKPKTAIASKQGWIEAVRKSESYERQAEIFYESYRIALTQEDEFRLRITDLTNEKERLNRGKSQADQEAQSAKNKNKQQMAKNKELQAQIDKLRKVLRSLQDQNIELKHESKVTHEESEDKLQIENEYARKTNKKRKLNEFLSSDGS